MSWDVIIMRFPEAIQATADLEKLTRPVDDLPLCGRAEFRAKVSVVFPGTDWSEPNWGRWRGAEGSVEFNIGSDETEALSLAMLHVRAESPVIARIVSLTASEGWKAIDTESGGFLGAPYGTGGLASWRTSRDSVVDSGGEPRAKNALPDIGEGVGE